MSNAVWSFPRLKRERFAAAAIAVSSTQKQQPFPVVTSKWRPDDEELSDDDTVRPRDLVASGGQLALQKKFLNRLAEILARQKTSPSTRAQISTDADHASAAMLGFKSRVPRIYVAKNVGLDRDDQIFLTKVQAWLRAISLLGQRRDIEEDHFWSSLIEYTQSRLEFYVSELADIKGISSHTSVRKLQDSCKGYKAGSESPTLSLTPIIVDAYHLRYKPLPQLRPKVVRLIGLLSRLRAAWETLQEFAMHHVFCRYIELHPIEASELIEIPINNIKLELEGIQQGLSTKVLATTRKRKKPLVLYTHAEVQLLLFFGGLNQAADSTKFIRYVGSSKKTCWLCEQTLLRQSGFSSRGSHAEVSAHWTVETKNPLEPRFLSKLIEGMCAIQSGLETRIHRPLNSSRRAVPQSTPAVTSSVSATTNVKMSHRRQGRETELSPTSVKSISRDRPPRVLGQQLTRILAIRLPVGGKSPELVTLDVCENLAGPEFTTWLASVPDFRPFWGDILHAQQDYQMMTVETDDNTANVGTVIVFYNTSEELPHNQCVANMLGVHEATESMRSRLFWQGDVFLVRFDETVPDGGAFVSLPVGAEMQGIVKRYLQHEWDRHGLEELRESRKSVRELSERHERNREMIRARL